MTPREGPSAEWVVLGGGPTGCTFASLMARRGHDVLIVDRSSIPPAGVGESLLPFGNRVLEQMGIDMSGFIRKDGAVFTRNGEATRFAFAEAARTTWDHAHQVPRDAFDAQFRRIARDAGVRFHIATVRKVDFEEARVTLHTSAGLVHGNTVVDAGGRHQLLARQLGLRDLHPTLRNAAITAHYRDVHRFAPAQLGDITICEFDGGWFWFIPFADGRTSVGLVMAPGCGLKGDRWTAALGRCPDAQRRLVDATAVSKHYGLQDFTAYARAFHGERWFLLGDAAMFLDPVFSSGVLLCLECASTLVDTLHGEAHGGDLNAWEASLREVAATFERAIVAWYTGDFLDVAFVPEELKVDRFRKGITSLLAGDLFAKGNNLPRRISRNLVPLAERVRRHLAQPTQRSLGD